MEIGVGQEAKVDVTMQPGEQTQTVTVTEAIPLVETTSATLTGNIESSEDRRPPAEWPQLRQLAHAAPWICQFNRAAAEATSPAWACGPAIPCSCSTA